MYQALFTLEYKVLEVQYGLLVVLDIVNKFGFIKGLTTLKSRSVANSIWSGNLQSSNPQITRLAQ
jgi:hypothetical protein